MLSHYSPRGTETPIINFSQDSQFSCKRNIMAYMFKARTVEPEKRPLLSNGCVTRNNAVTVGSGVSCAICADCKVMQQQKNGWKGVFCEVCAKAI
jgi:hypothetical protein